MRRRSSRAASRRVRFYDTGDRLERTWLMRNDGYRTVLCPIGTRPEAIKMAPGHQALQAAPCMARRRVLVRCAASRAGRADVGVSVSSPTLISTSCGPTSRWSSLTSRLLVSIHDHDRPSAARHDARRGDDDHRRGRGGGEFLALEGPFGHVEAGLRPTSFTPPFPEEANQSYRRVISAQSISPPTARSRDNLLREGVPPSPGLRHRQHGDRRLA